MGREHISSADTAVLRHLVDLHYELKAAPKRILRSGANGSIH